MNISERPIGIFDSGVGGLTVAKEVINLLPKEDIVYFGDTARVPYGSKSKELVYKFSCQIIKFLKEKCVKAIIIACNTVSSNCYEDLKKQFPNIPIIEVLEPGVNSAIKVTKNKKIGVIGTEATIRSGQYEKKLKDKLVGVEVFSKSCPLFVPLAEEGFLQDNISIDIAKMYLQQFKNNNIDSLILGCTHYPLLKSTIKKVVGDNVNIVDPAFETAIKMKNYLIDNNMNNTRGGKHKFYVSDKNDKFDFICSLILKENHIAEEVNIEKY
ncbi:glutamate racemase [[Clostridium] colinum]|uniref:glutamate racemase n=1 Tax=[Clostridium] colinum TaxID=36835 RepID=UPI0020247969|nr:glutamate racemase [[Clostridium] colinum]